VSRKLLLVGSVPLETAEEVMTTFGTPLGAHLTSMPDGEVGDRRYWVVKLAFQVFNGHPQMHTVKRPAPDGDTERLIPRDNTDRWAFALNDGVEKVSFGEPGWRLGYAKDALNSYFIFRTLREKGLLAPHLRFQVSIPSANSAVSPTMFPDREDLRKVREGMLPALKAEVAKIVEKIPGEDLAIQWDCSWEITDMYGGVPGWSAEQALERNAPQFRALCSDIPETVLVGYHLCFGTFGGWPRFAPPDLGATVDLANAMTAGSGRRIDWINIPTLDTTDDAFYAPLQRLEPRGATVYLGVIHNMARFEERLAVIRRYLPDFEYSAPCGFGRSSPEELKGILRDHVAAAGESAA